MSLAPGTRLGRYEILGPLGAGGMGEVYRGRDSRLERQVAIKVLAPGLAADADALQRFEREARAISALSHPHICALHDVGSDQGREYLVMEYLEGETLARRLERGPLPLAELTAIGIPIAEALEAAHRRGIVHRDLKPGNVMLTRAGVKLLDFGLARLAREEPAAMPSDASQRPTQSVALTREGTILGTLAYMAPEQLEGKPADRRTDVFALGAVLYEMASGRRPFDGESQASVITAVMSAEPAPLATGAGEAALPPALDRLVRGCLAKDADERWQSAGDVGRALREIAEAGVAPRGEAPAAAAAARRSPRRREVLAWSLLALALLAAGAAAWRLRAAPPPEPPVRFGVRPSGLGDFWGQVQLSPDGTRLAVMLRDGSGRTVVAVRPLDALEFHLLPGTEEARGMFWSPDGRELAFFSGGSLKREAAGGGPVRVVCPSGSAFNGAWGAGDSIVFQPELSGPLVTVSAAGGTPRPVVDVDRAHGEVFVSFPAFLADGRHFVYLSHRADRVSTGVALGSVDGMRPRYLFAADSSAVPAAPGYLLFSRDDTVFAWRWDDRRLATVGEPVAVLDHVKASSEDNYLALSAAGDRLAYLRWQPRRRLVWVDRRGRELGDLGAVGVYADVRLSPAGDRVAVSMRDPSRRNNFDIWVLDVARGTMARLTSELSDEFDPGWSADGKRLLYVSDQIGWYDLFSRPADGGPQTLELRSGEDKVLPQETPDGRTILFAAPAQDKFLRMAWTRGEPGPPRRLSDGTEFSEEHFELSPDGRLAAFESLESGAREVYVQALTGGPKRQVSVAGGLLPTWRRDGGELYYLAPSGELMAVPLHPGAPVTTGEPQVLFPLQLGITGELPFFRHPYDPTPDGQKFLVIRDAPGETPGGEVVVVTQWTRALGLR